MAAISKRGQLISQDMQKLLIGAGVAGVGAFLAYLVEFIGNVELGQWTPLVVAVLSVLANIVRKLASQTKY